MLRCTRKLLDRVPAFDPAPPDSTTVLGDWYGKPFQVGAKRLIILMSARSRLPVLMRAQDVAGLGRHFPDALAAVLTAIGVSAHSVDAEVARSREFVYAPTDDRSMLGSLNDFASMAQHRSRDSGDIDVVKLSVELSRTPIIAMGFGFPQDVTHELLGTGPRAF